MAIVPVIPSNALYLADWQFPYVTVDSIHFLGLTMHVFALLVGAAILTGFALAIWRGRRYGLARERVALFCIFLMAGGILGARLGRILYEPDLVAGALKQPGLVFLSFHGIASFGAYLGGLAGALIFFRIKRASIAERLQFLDVVGFALPFAWFLGRVGCALVHDHPGILGTGWLTVAFPGGSRYDLGLLEALFLLALAAVFVLLDRKQRLPGFYFALYFSVYGPFRFWLDRLHVDPPRYFGWSVDQYGAILATITGIAVWVLIYRASHSQFLTTENSHVIPRSSISEA